jgi:hypothetical protein
LGYISPETFFADLANRIPPITVKSTLIHPTDALDTMTFGVGNNFLSGGVKALTNRQRECAAMEEANGMGAVSLKRTSLRISKL